MKKDRLTKRKAIRTAVCLIAVFLCINLIAGLFFHFELAGKNRASENDFVYSLTDKSATLLKYNGNETDVEVPDSYNDLPVTKIASGAFKNCDAVSVKIGEAVETIGSAAFDGCVNITSITIPAAVTLIEPGAFRNCPALSGFYVSESNDTYSQIDGVLFDKAIKRLIIYPEGRTSPEYTVPYDCNELSEYSFTNPYLEIIGIKPPLKNVADNAFNGCDDLNTVYYMGKKISWNKIQFGKNNEKLLSSEIHYSMMRPNEFITGDVDRNSKINYDDASLLIKSLAGRKKLTDVQMLAADVTGDGILTARDARAIQMYTARLIDSFDDVNFANETIEDIKADDSEELGINVVKSLGFDNTGKSSISELLQKAVDSDKKGVSLYFPSGTYLFDTVVRIPSNVTIKGEGGTVFRAGERRHSTFFKVGSTDNTPGYTGFTNVEINNIIFDLGGEIDFDEKTGTLKYRAKFSNNALVAGKDDSDPKNNDSTYSNQGYYTYCPIVAEHGNNFRIVGCIFENGVYAGYTGSAGKTGLRSTNPHILDIGGVNNLLIEKCIFASCLVTPNAFMNWRAGNKNETGSPDNNTCDYIQLDATYGDGGKSGLDGPLDGTPCKNVVIRNNEFHGLPDYKRIVNLANDGSDRDDNDHNLMMRSLDGKTDFSMYRFATTAAVGCCHQTVKSVKGADGKIKKVNAPEYQPKNVAIYDNKFYGSWSSHYSSTSPFKTGGGISDLGCLNRNEPANSFSKGAIYAFNGAEGYDIFQNTFEESKSFENNKSTCCFLYGKEAGEFHDNVIINYGEPLPIGLKYENLVDGCGTVLEKKGTYFDGLQRYKAKNNTWIRGNIVEILSDNTHEKYDGECLYIGSDTFYKNCISKIFPTSGIFPYTSVTTSDTYNIQFAKALENGDTAPLVVIEIGSYFFKEKSIDSLKENLKYLVGSIKESMPSTRCLFVVSACPKTEQYLAGEYELLEGILLEQMTEITGDVYAVNRDLALDCNIHADRFEPDKITPKANVVSTVGVQRLGQKIDALMDNNSN